MFIRIGQAARYLGFSKTTLRNWDTSGYLIPHRSPGNHRLYTRNLLEDFIQFLTKFGKYKSNVNEINKYLEKQSLFKPIYEDQESNKDYSANSTAVAIYARVSTAKQKKSGNLERQQQRLKTYANNHGYQVIQVYKEVASGVNDRRRVLHRLLSHCRSKPPYQRVIIEYSDRLARFGYRYLESYFSACGIKLEILEEPETLRPSSSTGLNQEELVKDLIASITSFSARLYGSRGAKNRKKLQKNN